MVSVLLGLLIAVFVGYNTGGPSTNVAFGPAVGSRMTGKTIAAIGLGGFTIARRTLDTIGEGLTDLPILAAMIVSLIGATIITILSNLGVPASLAVSMTSCIIGLGWGRASRAVTVTEATEMAVEQEGLPDLSAGALIAEDTTTNPDTSTPPPGPTVGELGTSESAEDDGVTEPSTTTDSVEVPKIGEEDAEAFEEAPLLFDRAATSRVVFL